jgi:hypothetical protein
VRQGDICAKATGRRERRQFRREFLRRGVDRDVRHGDALLAGESRVDPRRQRMRHRMAEYGVAMRAHFSFSCNQRAASSAK